MNPSAAFQADPDCHIFLIQPGSDLVHALSRKVVVEDAPDDLRPFLIDYDFSALDSVSEGHGGRQEGSAFHAVLVAPAHIA